MQLKAVDDVMDALDAFKQERASRQSTHQTQSQSQSQVSKEGEGQSQSQSQSVIQTPKRGAVTSTPNPVMLATSMLINRIIRILIMFIRERRRTSGQRLLSMRL